MTVALPKGASLLPGPVVGCVGGCGFASGVVAGVASCAAPVVGIAAAITTRNVRTNRGTWNRDIPDSFRTTHGESSTHENEARLAASNHLNRCYEGRYHATPRRSCNTLLVQPMKG